MICRSFARIALCDGPRSLAVDGSLSSVLQARGYKATWVAPTLRAMKKRKELQLKKLGDFDVPRSKYVEWNHDAEIYAFGKRLGEEFDQQLLKKAFTHKSYIRQEFERRQSLGVDESSLSLQDNEELVTAGSRVISETVRKYLENVLPRVPEECLRSLENHLCSDSVLATSSSLLGTKDIILSDEYPPSESTLANTLKAVVASLEASSGVERTRQFIVDLVIVQIAHKDIYEIWDVKNPMGLLCKELESQRRALPEARILRETGANTIFGVFQVGLYSDRTLIGKGFGESPDIAETMAAHDALRRIYGLQDNMLPLPFGKKAASLIL